MNTRRVWFPVLAAGLGALLAVAPQVTGCSKVNGQASARVAKARHELVGGSRALGEVGDIVLSNGRIRAVVQNKGASRGFGVFGGSLIDLDLERPRTEGDERPAGGDGLSEIFPAFFLRGLEPDEVTIAADGSDGKQAVVRVAGKGSEFITQVKTANDFLLGTGFTFETDYILDPVGPDDPPEAGRFITIRCTAKNGSAEPISLSTDAFPIGFGLVVLMGGGQSLFLPGDAGFDLRFTLEAAYKNPPPLPGLPGVTSRFLASTGERVSYALAPEASKDNFLYRHRDLYPGATQDGLVVPFVASSFTGMFTHQPPPTLEPGKSTTFEVRVYVGSGDVASAVDLARLAKKEAVGFFAATVRETGTGVPIEGAVITLEDEKTKQVVTSCRTLRDGRARALLPPGSYTAAVVGPNRPTTRSKPFSVKDKESVYQELTVGQQAYLKAVVTDSTGRPIPAKISFVGQSSQEHAGKTPRSFLYDLRAGEPFLFTDLVPDDPTKPETLEYLERVLLTDHLGRAEGPVRPGRYRVVASRGVEYTIASKEVTLAPGSSKALGFKLEHVVSTDGYVSADFHVHTSLSIDADVSPEERALSFAAEGMEYLAVTDHNYVGDMTPAIERTGLSDWLKASVGLELTTLELGHFNTFPIKYATGAVTHGSFEWFRIPASDVFGRLRDLSALSRERSIVQVNHPRDALQGYFNAFGVDENANSTERKEAIRPQGPEFGQKNFSDDFDVIEVMNGKRLELARTFRVPATLPLPPLPDKIPAAGEIVRTKEGVPAFPGAIEDWLALLRRGKVVTGTANSDTHHVVDGEAGYPRTMVAAEEPRSMRALDDGVIADGLKRQAAIMTMGPMPELTVNGTPIGGLVSVKGGAVTIKVKVQAAPWIDVTRVTLLSSDGVRESLPLKEGTGVVRADVEVKKTLAKDAFFLVEVEGDRGMWPVATPQEIAPLLINDAVKSIGSAFGFGDDGFGNLRPSAVQPNLPFALTNPVWVDVDGDGVSFGKGRVSKPLSAVTRSRVGFQSRTVDVLKLLRTFER
jgi:hypothetical protein